MGCIDYSYVDRNMCKCLNGYVGVGYIKCTKETKTESGKLKLI